MSGFFIRHKGRVKKMKYVAICKSKKRPSTERPADRAEWVAVSRDELLHKKCKMIRCFETLTGKPQKLILMIDTNESDALSLLSRDLGNSWNIETYPVHELHEILEEDHSIVAG